MKHIIKICEEKLTLEENTALDIYIDETINLEVDKYIKRCEYLEQRCKELWDENESLKFKLFMRGVENGKVGSKKKD